MAGSADEYGAGPPDGEILAGIVGGDGNAGERIPTTPEGCEGVVVTEGAGAGTAVETAGGKAGCEEAGANESVVGVLVGVIAEVEVVLTGEGAVVPATGVVVSATGVPDVSIGTGSLIY